MTPELLALLSPEERAAWALCEGATPGPWIAGYTPSYLSHGQRADGASRAEDPLTIRSPAHTEEIATIWTYLLPTTGNAAHIADARTSLPAALTTIATLRADYAEAQARYGRAWEALCTIGDAVDKAGHYTLIPERALHVGDAVNALIAEADQLRAENATMRETLAEQQRAFVIGLDLAQRTADAEVAELRTRLTTGIGLPLGVKDRNGNPVHVGDTLAFDGREWGTADDYIYTVEFVRGEVQVAGTVSDIPSFCRVIKRWDAPKESP